MSTPAARASSLSIVVLVVGAVLGGCSGGEPAASESGTGSESSGSTTGSSGASGSTGATDSSSGGETSTGGASECEAVRAALQGVADAYVEAGVVGLVLAAQTAPCPILEVAAGAAELSPEAALTVDHRLRIGSVTKSLTAALLLLLQEEGLVDLDAPISDYVDTPIPNAGEIRVRQLLNHTSGLANYLNTPNFFAIADGVRVWTPAELVQLGVDLGPLFAPGEGWEYSNTNYIVAGMIAEAVTGLSFGQALRAYILDPVGLAESYFDGEETVEGALAHGYAPGEDLTWSHHPSAAWAAGAMVMSVGDLARWADALLRGSLLSEASMAELLDFVTTGSGASPYYGLGVEMPPPLAAGAVIGHSGLFPGYTSAMGLRAETDDVVVAISNTFGYFPQWDPVGHGLLALDGVNAERRVDARR